MTGFNVAFLDMMTPEARRIVQAAAPPGVAVNFVSRDDHAAQLALVPHADVIVTSGAPVSAALVAAAPRLRVIQRWGAGLDIIDVEAARRAGIAVAITAGANAPAVAELTVALMLAVYRRLPLVHQRLREGVWLKDAMRSVCHQLTGKTVGLVGFGNVARLVARRLSGFDVRIIYCSRRRAETSLASYVSFDELLAQSDVVSLHLPLHPETKRLIDAAAIGRMKTGSILINTARGGIVDEAALTDALTSGKLGGAGLDAWESEPVAPSNPLLALEQVVATPHFGGAVAETIETTARRVFENCQRLLLGLPIEPRDLIVPAPAHAASPRR